MRVGVVLEQCLAPVPGGTARYSREIAAALARQAPPGSQVLGVTAWHRHVESARVPGVVGPRRLGLPRRGLVGAWERGRGPAVPGDVVHALTPLAPPRRRTPLVVTVHDAVPWTHPETLTPRGVRWHRAAITAAAEHADLLVVPTHSVALALARFVALPPERVRVIPLAVSSDLLIPLDADERAARMQLPDDYLLTVATLEPRKGLSVLLGALAARSAPELPLLCVGPTGWGGVDPLAEAARLGLREGAVRVLGVVDDADLAVLLMRATALVAPSRAEGFGLPVLEAMSAGTPVVTSPDPALVEVGGGATLVATDDLLPAALRRVTEDADLRQQMATAGRVRAAAFDWDDSARQLWHAYTELGAGRA